MDPNLLYWKSHGQSFYSRLKIWVNLLDPISLLSSDAEIQKARTLLESGETQNEKSSVHADSGAVLPLVFRPPGTVVGSFLPHVTVSPAVFWQLLLQSYSAGFNYANRNSSSEQGRKTSLVQLLSMAGTVSFATCAGALPQIFISRLGIKSAPIQNILRTILPLPLSAALAFFNVYTVRSEEYVNGIQVFDSNGNPVGFSKTAGEKAVMETALSRAALFGATAVVPNLLVFFVFLHKMAALQRYSWLVAPLRQMSTVFVMGLMIPVSFSLYPQLGTIKRKNIEKELSAGAPAGQLYYHRGL
uniref:Sideroflexin 4 n=1 Tax=Sparus aurata TaxID=8175 RepID=A0A671XMA8_SPAAU